MSKNMTQKGLAFGAGFALLASGFVGVPANAIELTEGIPMKPASGPASATSILAADGATFEFRATPVPSVMAGTGTVKFKVTDPNAKFVPGAASTGGDSDTIVTAEMLDINTTLDTVTFTTVGIADGSYIVHFASSFFLNDGDDLDTNVAMASADSLLEVYVNSNVALIESENALAAGIDRAAATQSIVATFVKTSEVTFVTDTIADGAGDVNALDDTADTITLATVGVADGEYYIFPRTDFETDDADEVGGDVQVALEAAHVVKATVANNLVTIPTADIDDSVDEINGAEFLNFVLVNTVTDVRASDNSYVVDSGVTAAGASADIELVATDAVKRDVSVQAFVDDFANSSLDAGVEYSSTVQTASFLTRSDITWTTALTAPVPGDATLAAKITSNPLLNLAEDGNTDLVRIAFTRQDSTVTGISAATTQAAKTGVFSSTITTNVGGGDVLPLNTTTGAVGGAGEWTGLTAASAKVAADITAVSVTAAKVASVTLNVDHTLRTGDKITYAGADIAAMDETAATVTVTGARTFTYPLSETGVVTAATDADEGGGGYTVVTNGAGVSLTQRVFAGDYSAQAAVEDADNNNWIPSGAKNTLGTQASVAADTVVTTTASANVQGATVKNDVDNATDAQVIKGALEAVVTATIVDSKGVAVGSGRSVSATAITTGSTGVKVNGKTSPDAVFTDANGQVTFTVTDTVGATGTTVQLNIIPEGVAAAQTNFRLEWAAQTFSLYDLNTTEGAQATDDRHVLAGASYEMDLLIADQWYTPADSATYRLKVTGSGATEGIQTLTDGKTSVTISDNGIGTSFASNLIIQKLTAGTFADNSTVTITTKTVKADEAKVNLASDAATLYASATADLSDAVASKALVERDNRQAYSVRPDYTASSGGAVLITGKIAKASTGASYNDAVVTISGPSNILFSDGDVDARGGLTLVADNNGEFSVILYSTSAQTNTVITVASLGESATTKVTFTGQGVGEGTVLTIDTPANVAPAGTFQVKANLADAFGNGVDTTADRMKVTYSGAGIYFGTLPTQTDASGNLTFSVLLGANDTGAITVTVSYDQNGDGDFIDTKDLVTTKTITVGGSTSADTKVNAGSFKGYVAVYAKGYEGKRLSAKIGNDWVIIPSLASSYERIVDFTGAGVGISVRIYIDRVLLDTIELTTK